MLFTKHWNYYLELCYSYRIRPYRHLGAICGGGGWSIYSKMKSNFKGVIFIRLISFGKKVVQSPKIVVNLLWTYKKFQGKKEGKSEEKLIKL